MEKIKEYVDYLFKLNELNNPAMKEEIISNLIERYENLIKDGLDEQKAYIETIKTIGQLDLEEKNFEARFRYKPNWANIALFIALGLAVISTIILFITTVTSIVFTSISISLYIGASYYLYHLSQHTLKEEKDVIKHNELLKGIFSHLKTIIIFWSINFSYWIASVVTDIFVYNFILSTLGTLEVIEMAIGFIVIKIILTFILFWIFFFISRVIYNNLENKYFELTKEDSLDSLIKNKDFLYLNPTNKKILRQIFFVIIVVLQLLAVGFLNVTIFLRSGAQSTNINVSIFSKANLQENLVSSFSNILILLSVPMIIMSVIFDKPLFKGITFLMLVVADILFHIYLYVIMKEYNGYIIDNDFKLFVSLFFLVITVIYLGNYLIFDKKKHQGIKKE